jgi:uncharacterized protein
MMELPLFPLNTVLFPGMPLHLHVFEERYKLMMNTCIENREPFGVVLISNDVTDTNPNAEPNQIGCTAQITQVQPLSEGRMKITAIGKDRFQIQSLNHSKPYLTGMVETLALMEGDPQTMRMQAHQLKHRVNRYLELLKEAGQIQFQSSRLPENPQSLAYLAAVLLQTTPAQKQLLLAADDLTFLLDELQVTYGREVALLDAMLTPPDENDFRGSFSLN